MSAGAGKGSRPRKVDIKRYNANWDRIRWASRGPRYMQCPGCGWRMTRQEYMDIRVAVDCPDCGLYNMFDFLSSR